MTKAEIKHVKQLQQKKHRQASGEFLVEGWKSILDFLLADFVPKKIYSTSILKEYAKFTEIIDVKTLKSVSLLKNPKDALAIFEMKVYKKMPSKGVILALDNLQDPGNLGTIIRTADWFGIQNIVCSNDTVDCYNPKVVQATMGSLANVSVIYADLAQFLKESTLPIYGTFLSGKSIYETQIDKDVIIVIGNEGNGISDKISKLIDERISIPKHKNTRAESLNAAIATAIIVSNFRTPQA